MRPAKFSKRGWPPFQYGGQEFDLSHLDDFRFSVANTSGSDVQILTTFSDHCFTKDPESGAASALYYPHSDRRPGQFCFQRYQYSLSLQQRIVEASTGTVWALDRDNYAIVNTVILEGEALYYAVVFTIDRSPGLDTDLLMRVQTAHPRSRLDTFGSVRFKNLLQLRLANKHSKRVFDKGRKVPRLL